MSDMAKHAGGCPERLPTLTLRRGKRMPGVLLALPGAARSAAAVYADVLVRCRGADGTGDPVRMRVEGGKAGAVRLGDHARAARALVEIEAAIGPGTLALGQPLVSGPGQRRVPGGAPVVVPEVWLVRRVAVDWIEPGALLEALGLANSGRRHRVVAGALERALTRVSRCERAMSLFR